MTPVRFFESFDGTRLAYAQEGDGPDVVLMPSWLTHLDYQPKSIAWQPWLEALRGRYRVLRYDPRGCGLSDRGRKGAAHAFDPWVRDFAALVAHLGLDGFSLIGTCQGGAVAIEYAARNPGALRRLVLFGTYARGRNRRGDLPMEPEKAKVMLDMMRMGWGDPNSGFATAFAKQFQPDGGDAHLQSWCRLQEMAAEPDEAIALSEVMFDIDVRSALTVIGTPTLVVHARGDAVVPVAEGRLLAQRIPGARYLELETANHFPRADEPEWQRFVAALQDFLPRSEAAEALLERLTARERDVLREICRGRDNQSIARSLGISAKTVRNHASAVFAALDVTSRAEAIVRARDAGLDEALGGRGPG